MPAYHLSSSIITTLRKNKTSRSLDRRACHRESCSGDCVTCREVLELVEVDSCGIAVGLPLFRMTQEPIG
ncbi:hypothetical protein LSAT2_020613 [Lamellibrachia satsuma]|nr:hypothetical protein LSAT2_020613 [Lamellibrachia satsuma]